MSALNISMITSSRTLGQLQHKLDMLSNNIANVNTVGYKGREASFQDMLHQSINNQPHRHNEVGRQTPNGIRIGHGAHLSQTMIRMDQGALQKTERPLDFMIEGEKGWFRVLRTWTDEQGQAREAMMYTRDGRFNMEPHPTQADSMRLVTASGHPVLVVDEAGNEGELVVPANFDSVELGADGQLQFFDSRNPDVRETTNFSLAFIQRPDLLEGVGNNLFRFENEQQVVAAGAMELLHNMEPGDARLILHQGALEASNVDLTKSMTDMLTAQRMMQFQSRSISMADDMMGIANSIRG